MLNLQVKMFSKRCTMAAAIIQREIVINTVSGRVCLLERDRYCLALGVVEHKTAILFCLLFLFALWKTVVLVRLVAIVHISGFCDCLPEAEPEANNQILIFRQACCRLFSMTRLCCLTGILRGIQKKSN
ncbi:hypothetical protein T10_2669 [Trichinella papuae]|uniref:Uncharacterized protein n=1 Tax=Trichinella papuae TaxID=268474 RepID=A0A0V1MCG8_9BILA|nr:hypothetical protein T10_2669 [Trichinella papuae]